MKYVFLLGSLLAETPNFIAYGRSAVSVSPDDQADLTIYVGVPFMQSGQNLRCPRIICSRRCATPATVWLLLLLRELPSGQTDGRTDGHGTVLIRLPPGRRNNKF